MDDHLITSDAGEMIGGPPTHRSISSAAAAFKTRACANCARLKMKCQWPGTGLARPESTCTRCGRMNLTCRVPEPVPRKKRGKSTRVSQLEEKIEGLVSILTANQQLQAKVPSPLTPESQDYAQTDKPSISESPICGTADHTDLATDLSSFELFQGFRITDQQANAYLIVYREEFMPKYPFVVIPADLDAFELWTQSRVLFWCVMGAVAPQSVTVQNGVKRWFRRYIAEHVVVNREKRLDLLQAIMIHLGWGDYHFYIETPAVGLLQLALALVIDLKLDKPPLSSGHMNSSLLGDALLKAHRGLAKTGTVHTLDDKRALLGMFHITSLIHSMFDTTYPIPWTNYVASCCQSLVEAREYDSDLYIVALVKMQRIAHQAYDLIPMSDLLDKSQNVFRAPLDMAISRVHGELQTFADDQPRLVRENPLFWLLYNLLILRLYEPVLLMETPSGSNILTEPFRRSENLWKCLQACQAFFEAQLAVPISDVPTVPFTCTCPLSFALVTTSRLALLDASPDWQPALAHSKFDFGDVARRIAVQYERAEQWTRETDTRHRLVDDGGSIFTKYCFKLRWVRQWYQSKISPDQQHATPAANAAAAEEVGEQGDMLQFADLDWGNSMWEELFSSEDPTLLAPQNPGPPMT